MLFRVYLPAGDAAPEPADLGGGHKRLAFQVGQNFLDDFEWKRVYVSLLLLLLHLARRSIHVRSHPLLLVFWQLRRERPTAAGRWPPASVGRAENAARNQSRKIGDFGALFYQLCKTTLHWPRVDLRTNSEQSLSLKANGRDAVWNPANQSLLWCCADQWVAAVTPAANGRAST